MRALVIGGGRVGLGLASCLLQAGVETAVVARGSGAEALRQHGLARTGALGAHHAAPGSFAACSAVTAVTDGPYDYILVCVRTFDSEEAGRELALCPGLAGPATRVVLFQNGWGGHEALAAALPVADVLLARVITGFRLLARHHVEVTVHAAPVLIGSLKPGHSDVVSPLCQALTEGGMPTEVSPQIEPALWAKLLYNAMLNPLSALFGTTYGQLGASPHTRSIMAQIAAEGIAVLSAGGLGMPWPDVASFLDAFYVDMLPPTRQHQSSMLQDVQQGRQTEIDALNGAVVTLGRRRGVPTPTNESMVHLIHYLESARPHHAA